MGLRGPKKTPTAVLKMTGSWRANGRPDSQEPAEMPPPPSWLAGRVLEVWKELAPVLLQKGVLTVRDRNALARYCQLWHRWRQAEEFIDTYGSTYTITKTEKATGKEKVVNTKAHPQARLALALNTLLEKLEADFGMNPAARADILTPKDKAPIETRQRSG